MNRAIRGLLICALVAAGLAGAALVFGLFSADSAERRGAPPAAPISNADKEPNAPPGSETAAQHPAAGATIVVKLKSEERRKVTLEVIPRARNAFSIPCAEAARSLSLARSETQGVSPVVLAVPARRDLRLLASVSGDEIARWSTSVKPLAPGESVEIQVSLSDDADRIRGVVLDGATSRPIPGAAIGPDDPSDDFRCMRATTGADGTFSIPAPELLVAEGRLVARAPGYAPSGLAVGRDVIDFGESQIIRLVGAATLAVSVRRSNGSPVAGIGLAVVPSPVSTFLVVDRRAQTDASGRCAFADLPAGAALQLILYRDGALLHEEPEMPPLRAGERRELAIQLDSVRVRGRIVDQRGAPVVDGSVGVRRVSMRQGMLGPKDKFAAKAAADPAGRFVLEDIPSGPWLIEVAEGEGQPRNLASMPQQIVVGDRDVVDVTVIAYRDLFISGEVVDFASRPVVGAWIVGMAADETQHRAWVISDASGRFVLGPLGPAEYSVWSARASAAVRARPGEARVIVRLEPVAGLQGIVVDARSGAPIAAAVTASKLDSQTAYTESTRTREDGEFSFEDLPAGRWRLAAATATQRGHLPELLLRAGETIARLELRVEEAAVLDIVSTAVHARLSVIDAQGRAVCTILAEAAVSRCVVEPGPLTVREYAPAEGVTRELEVSVRPGDKRRVDFSVGKP